MILMSTEDTVPISPIHEITVMLQFPQQQFCICCFMMAAEYGYGLYSCGTYP